MTEFSFLDDKPFFLFANYAYVGLLVCDLTPPNQPIFTSYEPFCGLMKQQSEVWREVAWGTSVQEFRAEEEELGHWSLWML